MFFYIIIFLNFYLNLDQVSRRHYWHSQQKGSIVLLENVDFLGQKIDLKPFKGLITSVQDTASSVAQTISIGLISRFFYKLLPYKKNQLPSIPMYSKQLYLGKPLNPLRPKRLLLLETDQVILSLTSCLIQCF